jgi:hypothetical protein
VAGGDEAISFYSGELPAAKKGQSSSDWPRGYLGCTTACAGHVRQWTVVSGNRLAPLVLADSLAPVSSYHTLLWLSMDVVHNLSAVGSTVEPIQPSQMKEG